MIGRDGPPTEIDDRMVRVERAHLRVTEERTVDTLVVLPYRHEMTLPIVDESGPMPLSPENVRRLHRDTLYTGFNERYELRVYDGDGRLQRIARRAFEPEPLDMDWVNDLIDEAIELELEELEDPTQRRAFRLLIAGVRRLLVFPDFMPVFEEIRVARDGHVWVRTNLIEFLDFLDLDPPPTPGRWDVFTPEGRWLGEVVTPPGFDIHEIGDDYLLGVVSNELDVQFVAAFPLERSPRPAPVL